MDVRRFLTYGLQLLEDWIVRDLGNFGDVDIPHVGLIVPVGRVGRQRSVWQTEAEKGEATSPVFVRGVDCCLGGGERESPKEGVREWMSCARRGLPRNSHAFIRSFPPHEIDYEASYYEVLPDY